MNKVEGEKQGGYCRIYFDLCPTAKARIWLSMYR